MAAALLRDALAHAVDDHRTHHLGGIGEERPPVFGTKFPGMHKPQVRFVHQAGRVQHGVASAVPQPGACYPVQLGIGGRKQRIARLPITCL